MTHKSVLVKSIHLFFIWAFITHMAMGQSNTAIKVEVKKLNGKFVLYRAGKPYYIKGAGGTKHLDKVVRYGGNSVRTWGTDSGTRALLDEAHKLGLTVTVGLWVQHERHGFDYNDAERIASQLEQFTRVVRELKDHPAILAWGIGNEVNLFYKNTKVWEAVNDIAKMVHREDPNHPTMTVTAGIGKEETALIKSQCPEIDILGVNSYAGLPEVPSKIREYEWTKPYIVTEWGFTGHWEIAKTSWGVAIEETSTEKAIAYKTRYEQSIKTDTTQCIGSYVFLWGSKIEYTPTWCGMFLETGEELETVGVMNYLWTGKWPSNKAPLIQPILVNNLPAIKSVTLEPGSEHKAIAKATDPDKDPIMYEWMILYESTNKLSGGDAENKPKEIKGLILSQKDAAITFKTPGQPGEYRLYVYVYDGHNHVATANFPFLVE